MKHFLASVDFYLMFHITLCVVCCPVQWDDARLVKNNFNYSHVQ